eukprot:TRINITY_DN41674_c0_g1_i1.p1 TRINITY_DN41674_c0_g1~~TRINITY_DN41674_c0_g1_i1.p1  ORF type:complete len:205 (-),score=37.42 TRINITY_DN41674_c0_g1_i1:81-695(-)
MAGMSAEDIRWYERAKIGVIIVWALVALVDTIFLVQGYWNCWLGLMLFVIEFWGGFDAVLRFPALYDLESMTVIKHILLLVLKYVWFFIVLMVDRRARRFSWTWLAVPFINVLAPSAYLLVLPLEETSDDQRFLMASVVDEDILLRIFRFLRSSERRAECIRRWKIGAQRQGLAMAKRSPLAAEVMGQLNPNSRLHLKKATRSV